MENQIKYQVSVLITGDTGETLDQFIEAKRDKMESLIRACWRDFSSEQGIEVTGPGIDVDFSKAVETLVQVTDPPNVQMPVTIASGEEPPEQPDAGTPPEDDAPTTKKEDSPSLEKKGNRGAYSEAGELFRNVNIVIPNGKVNVPYNHPFRAEDYGLKDVNHISFEGLEPVGLYFDPDASMITGTPTTAGDHKIKLLVKQASWGENRSPLEKVFTLIINPDPKSLWKNIETPTSTEYYKKDSHSAFLLTTEKSMLGASQRGRSHAQEGKPRDDDFAFDFFEDNQWRVIAVADGAGSAAFSRKGSQIACNTVVEVCAEKISDFLTQFEGHIRQFHQERSDANRKLVGDNLYHILGNAVFQSARNIEREAKAAQRPVKDFSTTLIAAVCKKFDFGWFVGSFWVGDGGIGIYDRETPFLKILCEPDGGEYAGQTRFLTMPEITQPAELYRRLRFDIVGDFTALVLMTDGVTDPKFETDANLMRPERWDQLWQDLTEAVDFQSGPQTASGQLLNWLDFWSPGNHDDRTIAMLL